MFVNEVNDVKIYNLSAGKSVPDWLTDRRKRSQLMKKGDSRRQIELIQDFDMPGVCTSIRMSPDQQYILATGTYKPRVKCFEVSNLSIKFERCFDSEVTTFEVISDDYSKMVFLQCDRYVEIHAAHGRHYRLRIPRFGRDMKYHKPSCDMFIVGVGRDIYRLNLERGQFLQPYETDASCLNACEVNPEHHLLVVGTKEGTVEAWDPRSKQRCATLDVAMKLPGVKEFPSVTALKFRNGLHMGVGTASGHVLLYDIRSRQPLLTKNHLNNLPIKRLAFNPAPNAVYSLDEATLKLWDEQTGKQIAYVESTTSFNDFCTIPDSGMFFLAQEDVKMLTYYVPAMGPAPRWCAFLDNLTEEIESEVVENVYDDYQFVTQKELAELGMEHLIGSNLLKGYMHGYFMNVRLYNKAKSVVEPFAFDRFRKEKVRQEIESERKSRLQIESKLPKVNKELALKIMDEQANPSNSAKQRNVPNLLQDSRFKAMFENTDFAVNKEAEEYRLLAPVLNRLDKSKAKELKQRIEVAHVAELHADEAQTREESDNDEDLFGFEKSNSEESSGDEASSDDDDRREYVKEMKQAYKQVKQQRDEEEQAENGEEEPDGPDDYVSPLANVNGDSNSKTSASPLNKLNFKLTAIDKEQGNTELQRRIKQVSLQDRVRVMTSLEGQVTNVGRSIGNRQMTFEINREKKSQHIAKKREAELKKHREERRGIVRPIKSLKLKKVNFK
ncbi:nucleolar protein 10 [Drosophila sulfurigaster albostrigata]|uniref:nucleolar protein 10 n=1 Tax=Drosophila sulfurigaster albostrigata TaxID=89887 RepID=UPI002D21C219|nr:nucleolar protein 10 [Drosophila sulfurigaster albostrigata]